MPADRAWVERNLGFDPIATPAPVSTFAVPRAARAPRLEDIQREIIEFDSEGAEGSEFLAFSTATGLSRVTEIRWPRGLAPKTGTAPRDKKGRPLPRADVLVVTWTLDEGHALSRVLTPGKDSRNDYLPYTHIYRSDAKKMVPGCPATEAKRLGTWWTTAIGGKSVVAWGSPPDLTLISGPFGTRKSVEMPYLLAENRATYPEVQARLGPLS